MYLIIAYGITPFSPGILYRLIIAFRKDICQNAFLRMADMPGQAICCFVNISGEQSQQNLLVVI